MRGIIRRMTGAAMALTVFLCGSFCVYAEETAGPEPQGQFVFSDIPSWEWYEPYVTRLNGAGLISGYEDGTFRPENTITVGEYMALCVYAVDVKAPLRARREGEHWAAPVFEYALSRGIVTAEDGFDRVLDQPVRREDMAYILMNAAACRGENIRAVTNIRYMMTDHGQIAADRRDAMERAYSAGMMVGTYGMFYPQSSATRAEAATVLTKLLWPEERPKITVADVQFVNKEMTPVQVRTEAKKMAADIDKTWDQINDLWVRWMNIENEEKLYLLDWEEGNPYFDLDRRMQAAKDSGDAALTAELSALAQEYERKRKLHDAINDVYQFPDNSARLRAQTDRIPQFTQYADTYPLQLIAAETSQFLTAIRGKESWLQGIYDEYIAAGAAQPQS